jgi:lipid II:glycine glycyltransferase (peptidoglycan interpeptide bridge formation enzyme)
VCAVCDTNDEIIAGLPVMETKSWLTGRRWVSLPFTDHCLPLYENASALDCLVDGLLNQVIAQGLPKLELRGEFPSHSALQQFSPYVLHTLSFDVDFSKVYCRIHPMHQRNAKIAMKRGVRIELGTNPQHMKAFYQLHLETRRRQGVPAQPWRFFDLLGKILLEEDLGFVLLAYQKDKIIAAMVLLEWGQTLTFKYGASNKAFLNLRPNDLLFTTVIQWGCENGFKIFDLGRTDIANTGLRAFKTRWGAEETPLIYSVLSGNPPKFLTNRMMSVMQVIIRNSPLWFCEMAGRLLYHYFG